MNTVVKDFDDEAEEHFWDDGGTYEKIGERVTAYIKEHRDVTDVSYPKDASIDAYMKIDRDLQDGKVYRNMVSFSAYPRVYTDNLDEVAVEGRIQFRTKHQSFFGGMAEEVRKDYESEILTNPTWMEVALCANDMINCTGDNHHVFLEAIHKTGQFTLDDKSFVLIYDFSMGS